MLNTGLRFDYFYFSNKNNVTGNDKTTEQAHKSIISPKINLTYHLNNQLQLYIKAGKGFHSNDARVVTTNSNLSVLPGAYGIDLGIICKPVNNIFVNVAAWYLYLKQEFIFEQDLSDQVYEPYHRAAEQ